MHPAYVSSAFVPYLNFPAELVSILASSVLAVGVSYRGRLQFVSRKHLFAIIMAPKRKRSYAGTASKPKMSRDVIPTLRK
jgi:hypothetical protein